MRIVVSYAKPHKAQKYKDSLMGVNGSGVEIVDAHSAAAVPSGGWRTLLEGAQGLLLTGGSDVEPERYGEATDPSAGVYITPERDAMEWDLLAAARSARLPVFAICRGHQVVNAFLGGTLWQDLGRISSDVKRRHDLDDSDRRRLGHGFDVGAGSDPFSELLRRSGSVAVNSLHHQAVKLPASDLRVVATSDDGVVEAMAHADPDWWLWAVQWHPEELTEPGDHPVHAELFRSFLTACKESR